MARHCITSWVLNNYGPITVEKHDECWAKARENN